VSTTLGPDYWGRRPLPWPDEVSRPFFEAAANGRLLLQRCAACSKSVFYPRPFCPTCGGDLEWVELGGIGRVHTFTVIRQNLSSAFRDEVPYVVAMVDVEEGARMMGNVIDCAVEDVHIGMEVEAVLVKIAEGIGMPLWRPLAAYHT
jgi:uncharacterized OB-fold protein